MASIKKRRKRLKLCQVKLCKIAKTSRYNLSMHEAGTQRLKPEERVKLEKTLTNLEAKK